MSVSTKMTAIANKIREILGLSGKMGLDAMATNLGKVESEVSDQTELINQIVTILESKSSPYLNTCYIGTSIPSDNIGKNGDIYIVKED